MESLVLRSDNSHFSMLTSSILHPKSKLLEPQIAPSATTVTASSPSVANRGAHKTVAMLALGAQSGQDCNLILSIHLRGEFIAYVVVNTCSRYVPPAGRFGQSAS